MQTSARIRRARSDDATAIAKVHVETWRAAYAGIVPDSYLVRMTESGQAFTWRKLLGRKQAEETVLVVEAPTPERRGAPETSDSSHDIVAFGSCGVQRDSTLTYKGEVFTLYVAPDWQAQGIGRQLLGALFRRLYEAGVGNAVIWVLADNPARFFYERMGGQRIAEREQTFAGKALVETAFAWPDLEAWLNQVGV